QDRRSPPGAPFAASPEAADAETRPLMERCFMNNKLLFGFLTGLIVVGGPSALRQAHADTEEAPATDAGRVRTLAKQYDVSAETVEGLRNKGQGWGEITTELAMSRQLSKTDPK